MGERKKFSIGWFDKKLSPNSRAHWRAKQTPKKEQKQAAWAWALHSGAPPIQDTYHLQITFYPPTNAQRDLDNCLASIKAALDGIAEAWHVNDKQFRPITIDFGEKVKGGNITIELVSKRA